MGLRTQEGVDFTLAERRFAMDAFPALEPLLAAWALRGHARLEGPLFSLTDRGMDLMDALLVDCFLALDAQDPSPRR